MNGCDCVPINFIYKNEMVGQIWLVGLSLSAPRLEETEYPDKLREHGIVYLSPRNSQST